MPHVHAPGLVLRFDPQALAAHDVTHVGSDDDVLSQPLYFVCIEANPKDALWVPLFAGPGPGRKGILANAKTGHSQWTRNSSFYHAGQICRIGHKTAAKAAEAGRDQSTPRSPNRLAPGHVPARAEFPADSAFGPMTRSA